MIHTYPILALGLMSGTSMDGVDVALLETNGETVTAFGPTSFLPYSDDDRALLRAALVEAKNLTDRTARPGALAQAEALTDQRHIEAVCAFRAAFPQVKFDLIGFHGQTVIHRPERRLTVQIGRGQVLADALDVPVVFDMRAADVAAGGQGAPLVPVYHQALMRAANLGHKTALLNIGGVANITYLATPDAEPVACDTGPGNALLDDLMLERTGVAMDKDGATAARGKVHTEILEKALRESFFELPAPKSLDRNAFSKNMVNGLSTEDAAATLTAFTAAAVARFAHQHVESFSQLESLSQLIVCGGGARNPTMIQSLKNMLHCPVLTAESFGWSSDAMEAQAFAFLAVRALRQLPLTFPKTTGCPAPLCGGRLAKPKRP